MDEKRRRRERTIRTSSKRSVHQLGDLRVGTIVRGRTKESARGWLFGEPGGSYNKVRSTPGSNVLLARPHGVMPAMEGSLIVAMGEY